MRVLFVPQAGALGMGGITRLLALASEAQLRGHTVAFLAPAELPLLTTYHSGVQFEHHAPRFRGAVAGEAQSFAESLQIRGMLDVDYLSAAVHRELQSYAEFRPDLVVTENQITVPISAALAGVSYAATAATINLEEDDRPEVVVDVTRMLRWTMAQASLQVDSLSELLHGSAVLNIAPTIRSLEPALGALPNIFYMGPLLFAPLELRPCEFPPPDGKQRLLVYLSRGLVTPAALLHEMSTAFPQGEYSVLVALATRQPDLVLPDGWAQAVLPGMTVGLQACDALITRGGQNTIMAAALAAKPVVGTPGFSKEPTFNIQGLEQLRIARLLPGHPTGTGLLQAVEELRASDAVTNAEALAQSLRLAPGISGLWQKLEERS